ncbi:hypothetical protein DFH27DRAFT_609661 [Peziza echinospora]|nr:hypothetical protein DFH27DRAFT_609661 [Peziza echinospora]
MSKPDPQIGSTEWEHRYTMRHLEQRLEQRLAQQAREAAAPNEDRPRAPVGRARRLPISNVRNRAQGQAQGTPAQNQAPTIRPTLRRQHAVLQDQNDNAVENLIDERFIEPPARPMPRRDDQVPRPIYWAQGVHLVGSAEEREAEEAATLLRIVAMQDEIEGRVGEEEVE